MPKYLMKLTYEQFVKKMVEGDEMTRGMLYDDYSYAYKERERQREKSRRQWEAKKAAKAEPQRRVDLAEFYATPK